MIVDLTPMFDVTPMFDDLAALIHAMYLKNSLCQVDANCRNLHFWMPLSLVSGQFCSHYFGTLMPY